MRIKIGMLWHTDFFIRKISKAYCKEAQNMVLLNIFSMQRGSFKCQEN